MRALLGAAPHRCELLIEYLHLNDAYRCLFVRLLVALAQEMNLPMAGEQAPVTVVHQCPVPLATVETVVSMVKSAVALHPYAP